MLQLTAVEKHGAASIHRDCVGRQGKHDTTGGRRPLFEHGDLQWQHSIRASVEALRMHVAERAQQHLGEAAVIARIRAEQCQVEACVHRFTGTVVEACSRCGLLIPLQRAHLVAREWSRTFELHFENGFLQRDRLFAYRHDRVAEERNACDV